MKKKWTDAEILEKFGHEKWTSYKKRLGYLGISDAMPLSELMDNINQALTDVHEDRHKDVMVYDDGDYDNCPSWTLVLYDCETDEEFVERKRKALARFAEYEKQLKEKREADDLKEYERLKKKFKGR